MKIKASLVLTLTFVSFGVLTTAQAVIPAPDGGYPGGNTAEGQAALLSLTTGGFNTAVGFLSLRTNTDGQLNTAVGAGSLLSNVGNRTAGEGVNNTAIGAAALLFNTTGSDNTAVGVSALLNNDSGGVNTAIGESALLQNTDGDFNTAIGFRALVNNTTGNDNTAIGRSALATSTSANNNTAVGSTALFNTTGGGNTALGFGAGSAQTTGSSNIYIGANVTGVAAESNTCYIRNIFGAMSARGTPVLINSDNKLGTTTSSKRFKEEITSMDRGSEALFSLKPVTFRYKKEIDPAGALQFGLVAEDVEKVNPDLVVRDKEGKPYSVRYDQVNAMLLNEFLKEHRKVEDQKAAITELKAIVEQQQKEFQAAIAEQRKQFEARLKQQDARIQRISTQLELNNSTTRTVANNE
jgi:trimeric autotransporter adhesin